MENLNNNTENFEEYIPSPEDFKLTQADTKIHDKKFETKTTTFAKDAFKRFCKNKSSVVAAFIIGFLILCAIFVPIFSPYNTDSPEPSHSLLKPKLFEAGTGFWDGTKKYENITWDAVNQTPSGFKPNAVVEGTLVVSEGEKIDTAHKNAIGGYMRFTAESVDSQPAGDAKYASGNVKRLWNHTPFTITADGNYEVEITLGNVDGIIGEQLGEYRISLVTANPKNIKDSKHTLVAEVCEWTTDHAPVYVDGDGVSHTGVIKINLSDYVKELGLEELENARLQFEIVRDTVNSYMLIESIVFSADIEDEEQLALLEEISMTDANANILNGQMNQEGGYPVDYWRSTGLRLVYQANIGLVSFSYDIYEDQLGLFTHEYIGQSDIVKYIKNGWMKYDFTVGPSSFEVLDEEHCPIVAVHDAFYSEEFGVWTLDCDMIKYKYQGYTSMPKYLFGTTKEGKDLITLAFISLRTSLLIAFLSSFICLAIGLVWGSVSGYFGGNVDLAMERFCEILSGVPFIVVMTLVILHFGNTIGVFAFGLCITGWLGVAGRTRTQFYRFKGREYVLASRTLGASDTRLIFKHILPNALGTIVTGSVLMIPSVIFSEASLSYLNLGLQGVESFGVLLSKNQAYLKSDAILILFPAAIISLLMISFNLFGNGLRDALNPSLKGSE